MSGPGMLIIHAKRCIACKRCMIECAVAHSASKELVGAIREGTNEPRIAVRQWGAFTTAIQCRHCEKPPCVPSCPNQALEKDGRDVPVLLDLAACTGAGKCVKRCPFQGIWMNRSKKQAIKCDLCVGREAGPACAEACPTSAIAYKRADELTEAERAYYSGHPGSALVRREGVRHEIDPKACTACRKCAMICPAEAIEGAKKTPHKIIQERCVQCGGCYVVCPADAVRVL